MDQREVEKGLEMLSLHQQDIPKGQRKVFFEDIHNGHKFINICKQITKLNSIKKTRSSLKIPV